MLSVFISAAVAMASVEFHGDLQKEMKPAAAEDVAVYKRSNDVWFTMDETPKKDGTKLTFTGHLTNRNAEPRKAIFWVDETPLRVELSWSVYVQGDAVQAKRPVPKPYEVTIPAKSSLDVSKDIDLAKLDYVGSPKIYATWKFYLQDQTFAMSSNIEVTLPSRPAPAVLSGDWLSFKARSHAKQTCSPEVSEKEPFKIAMPKELWLKKKEPLPICISFFNKDGARPGDFISLDVKEIGGRGRKGNEGFALNKGKTEWVQPRISDEEAKSYQDQGMNVEFASSPQSQESANPFAGKGAKYMSYDLNEFRNGTVSVFEDSTQAGPGEGQKGEFEITASYGKLKAPPIRVFFRGQQSTDL